MSPSYLAYKAWHGLAPASVNSSSTPCPQVLMLQPQWLPSCPANVPSMYYLRLLLWKIRSHFAWLTLSVLVRVLHRRRINWFFFIFKEILLWRIRVCQYGDHSVLSTNWRPKTAGGVIQSESEGWELEELMVWIPVQRQEKMKWDFPAQVVRQETGKWEQIPLSSMFCSIQNGLTDAQSGEGNIFYRVHWF